MPCPTTPPPKPALTLAFEDNDLLDLIDNNIEPLDIPNDNTSPTTTVVSLDFSSEDELTPSTITITDTFTPLATPSFPSDDSASQDPTGLTTSPAPLPSTTYTIQTSTAPLPMSTSTDYLSSSPSSISSALDNSIPTATSSPIALATANSQISSTSDQSIDESTPVMKIIGIIFTILGSLILIFIILKSILKFKRKKRKSNEPIDLENLSIHDHHHQTSTANSSIKFNQSSVGLKNNQQVHQFKKSISYPIQINPDSSHPIHSPRPLPISLSHQRFIPVSKPIRMKSGRRGIGSFIPSSSIPRETPQSPRVPKLTRTIYSTRHPSNMNSSRSSSDSILSYPTTIESKIDSDGNAQVDKPVNLSPISEKSNHIRLVSKSTLTQTQIQNRIDLHHHQHQDETSPG
ncbi:hypothetical protein DFH28DRAFT_1217037 [Melampsora americana]|nr:hypothetical protein DFH28DRAFT_1217037 [Melampsora americana]